MALAVKPSAPTHLAPGRQDARPDGEAASPGGTAALTCPVAGAAVEAQKLEHAQPRMCGLHLLAEDLPRRREVDDGVPDPLEREHDRGRDVESVRRLVRVHERVNSVDGRRRPRHQHRDGEDERRAQVRELDRVHVAQLGAEAPHPPSRALEDVQPSPHPDHWGCRHLPPPGPAAGADVGGERWQGSRWRWIAVVVILRCRASGDGRGKLSAVEAYVLEVVRLAAGGRLGEPEWIAVIAIDERHGG